MKYGAAILGVALMAFGAGTANAANSFWLGAQAGAGFPTGDYADAASTGWNIGVTGVNMVNDNWGFGGDVAYHAWNASDDLETKIAPDEFHWSAIQVTGHTMYRFPTTGNVRPFAKAGLGLYALSGKVTSTVSGDETFSANKLGFNFGGGFNVMTTGNQMWGISGTYHIIPSSGDFGSSTNVKANAFSIGLHMMWGVNNR